MVRGKSPLFVIFTTVMIDLIGFGMVIPLVGLYGRHFEASGFQLSLLGGIYSLMSLAQRLATCCLPSRKTTKCSWSPAPWEVSSQEIFLLLKLTSLTSRSPRSEPRAWA